MTGFLRVAVENNGCADAYLYHFNKIANYLTDFYNYLHAHGLINTPYVQDLMSKNLYALSSDRFSVNITLKKGIETKIGHEIYATFCLQHRDHIIDQAISKKWTPAAHNFRDSACCTSFLTYLNFCKNEDFHQFCKHKYGVTLKWPEHVKFGQFGTIMGGMYVLARPPLTALVFLAVTGREMICEYIM